MTKEKYIKICPECGSIDISIPASGLDVKFTVAPNTCRSCGYIGRFPIVEKKTINLFKKELKKRK